MKSDYAEYLGISYQTAWRHFKAGKIPYPTHQLDSGTIIVDYDPKILPSTVNKCAIYIKVSSAENRQLTVPHDKTSGVPSFYRVGLLAVES